MDKKDQEILSYNKKFMKKVLKSALNTLFICMLSIIGIFSIVGIIFNNMSVEQSNVWIVICMCIGIIFTMFFCTYTIIEEIRRGK